MTSRTSRTGRRRPRRAPVLAAALAGLLVALGGVLAGASPAQAASLDNSSPSAGAKLQSAPSAVKLTFTTIILLGTASVSVTGPGGSATQGGPQVFGLTVTQGLRSGLGPGTYAVSWRIAGLLHSDTGGYSFTIAGPSSGGGTKPQPTASKAPKPKPRPTATPKPSPTGPATPTPTPTGSPTATPTTPDTTSALIPVNTTTPTPSFDVDAEAAPDVRGVSYTGSSRMPSPAVLWGVIMLIAVAGWVFVRVRRGGSI